MIIGIDIGASTTKAVALEGLRPAIVSFQNIKATASASTALERILGTMGKSPEDVKVIAVSGGGARSVGKMLLDIPVTKVNEVKAIGMGGLFLSEKKQSLIVSMGTGTALVAVYDEGKRIIHIGGTGVGGGTLQGLSRWMLHKHNFETVEKMATAGDVRKVDLMVADVAGGPVGIIPGEATASNFGRLSIDASEDDIAAAIFNMVSQVIGVITAYAAKAYGLEKDVVLVGGLARSRRITESIRDVADMFHVNLCIPENSEYCVAIGAAKSTFDRTHSENARKSSL